MGMLGRTNYAYFSAPFSRASRVPWRPLAGGEFPLTYWTTEPHVKEHAEGASASWGSLKSPLVPGLHREVKEGAPLASQTCSSHPTRHTLPTGTPTLPSPPRGLRSNATSPQNSPGPRSAGHSVAPWPLSLFVPPPPHFPTPTS